MKPVDTELLLQEWQNGIDNDLQLSRRGYVFIVNSIRQRRDLITEKMPLVVENLLRHDIHDLNLYSRIITTYAKTGYWERAQDVFRRINEKSMAPDIELCNSLLHAYSIVGRWHACMELFEEMLMNGINPNHTSFVHLLDSLNRANQWEKAVTVLRFFVWSETW